MSLLYDKESDFRQERNFGQKFSAAFEFIGVHWRGLGQALLVIVVPVMLLRSILSALIQNQMRDVLIAPNYGEGFGARMSTLNQIASTPMYWANIVLGTLTSTLIILTVYCYLVLYLRRSTPGPAVTVAEVWAEVRSRLLPNVLSIWAIFLVVLIGLFILFIPGMYLLVSLSLFFIIRVVEDKGFGNSFSRSLYLVKGKWWSTFGLLAVMVVILYLFLLFVGGATVLLSNGVQGMLHFLVQSPVLATVYQAVVSIISLSFYLPLLLVLAFQYFNLVERKEGAGLYLLVNQLGQAPAEARNEDYRPHDEGEY